LFWRRKDTLARTGTGSPDPPVRNVVLNLEQPNAQQRSRSRPVLTSLLIKSFFPMLRRMVLSPSSGRPNLVTVDSAMTGRRECVQYVAILGTIGPGYFIRCRESLRAGQWIGSLRRRDSPQPSRPALWLIQLRTRLALCLFQG
jgi:hypothetical protein